MIPGILFACFLYAQSFRLAPPLLKYETAFFSGATRLPILFDQPGTSVRYTMDGKEPSEKSALYKTPLIIKNRIVTITAKSFSNSALASSPDRYLPSQPVQVTFIRDGYKIKDIKCTDPDKQYPANGAASLTDNKGGLSSGPTWLGFQNDSVVIELSLTQPQQIHEVLLDFLQNEGSWIFLPAHISVYNYDPKSKSWISFADETYAHNAPSPGNQPIYKIIKPVKAPVVSDKLMIKIQTVKKIPDWHEGKGNHGWLFIDEIKVY